MSSQNSDSHDKHNQNEHRVRRFLGRKRWLGAGVIVSAIGATVAAWPLIQGSGSSSTQTIRANNGNCIIQSGNGNTCNADQVQSPRAASSAGLTSAQSRLTDCRALTADASEESTQLMILKSTISIDGPTSRVTGHTAGFAAAYDRTLNLMQLVLARKNNFKSDGGVINVDLKLDGDLNDMASALPSLHEAVVIEGRGGAQWNQLSDYSHHFGLLTGLKCVL